MKSFIVSLIGLVFVVAASAEPLLEGRVRLESGEPVADAQVRIFDLSDLRQGAIARALTDGTGYFALPLATLGGRALPAQFALGPNYPNPFNPSTIIPYQLAASSEMRLEVFNLLGQHIATLVDGERAAGFHTATWHATDGAGRAVGAGVYIYRMTVGVERQTGRMVLIDGQAGLAAGGAASILPGASGIGGLDGEGAQVYGLIVSGRGLVPYVDSAFRVESGMAPVELMVSSGPYSAGKAADDDCAFCGLLGASNDQQQEEEDETEKEETETDSTSSEGGPDLIVQSPSASAVVLTPGQAFTLQVTVQNQGDQPAAATMLHYYRSNNTTITASDREVGTDAVDALDASATSEQSIALTASVGVEKYYGACVASVRGESNTDNNCSSAVKITVSGQEATEEEEDETPEGEGFYTPDTIPYDHLRTVIADALGKAKGASITEAEMETLWRSERSADRWPSAKYPVDQSDVASRLAAAVFVVKQSRTPPEFVRAHPAAADFPGSVPTDAPRFTRTLTINTTEPRGHSTSLYSWPHVPRWHSTGLYAAPGELVTVTVPATVAAAGDFHVRVGAHSDDISVRDKWTRMPQISRRFPLSAVKTLVANAFGGLIYVEVPVAANLGKITVKIEGAVAAPLFVLGETDLAAWRNAIRHAPAPWAEIAGRNMIVTTPASEVRDLDDPAAVAETWDRVLDLNAELAAWPSPARLRPERFVVDRQIRIGYMHAGYPIMAHLDQQANLVNAEHLRWEGNWGFYHEVGHNHQSSDWTFDGTVEVTVNLFTLYVYEFLCGIPVDRSYHGWADSRSRAMIVRFPFDNPDFEQWKREPALALFMYVQLQQAFGWDAYKQVFATYRALSDAERPHDDAEKRDQWLVRFSRQVGRNLGPFFEAWGVPTSRAARNSITDLPVWLPPDLP